MWTIFKSFADGELRLEAFAQANAITPFNASHQVTGGIRMDMSTIIAVSGFIVTLIIQIFSAGLFLGGLIFSIKYMGEQIKRLEEKQDKHNNLIERMAHVEDSTKSAHKRIDEMKGEVHG